MCIYICLCIYHSGRGVEPIRRLIGLYRFAESYRIIGNRFESYLNLFAHLFCTFFGAPQKTHDFHVRFFAFGCSLSVFGFPLAVCCFSLASFGFPLQLQAHELAELDSLLFPSLDSSRKVSSVLILVSSKSKSSWPPPTGSEH